MANVLAVTQEYTDRGGKLGTPVLGIFPTSKRARDVPHRDDRHGPVGLVLYLFYK